MSSARRGQRAGQAAAPASGSRTRPGGSQRPSRAYGARLHELLGKRFEFASGSWPDVTLVAYAPAAGSRAGTVRLHATDGGRQTLSARLFLLAYTAGALVESREAPFVHGRGQ